jgi:GT2 family glycosyltransferase
MPIAIAGMHRSGTSMVAHVLKLGGVYFGDLQDLFEPTEENPDGYWEHVDFVGLNDEILAQLGGGWDKPPLVPRRFRDDKRLSGFSSRAKRLVREFDGREPWAWKDPRNSLTVDLWAEVVPDLSLVVCIRNPLDVAISLRRRAMFSYPNSLELWETYYRRLLDATADGSRIVTDYESYFSRSRVELKRLFGFVGLPASGSTFDQAGEAVNVHLRHSSFTVQDLLDAEVAPDIVELYLLLRREAGLRDPAKRWFAKPPTKEAAQTGPVVDTNALDMTALRQRVKALESIVAVRELELGYVKDGREADRHTARVEQKQLEATLRSRERELAVRDQELGRATAAAERAEHVEAERWQLLSGELERLRIEVEELQASVYDLHATAGSGGEDYPKLVRRLKQLVRRHVPREATVLVVSKGDDHLLELDGREAWHFPRAESGLYAGYHPECSLSAIAHLEALRARGADHFLLPSTAYWWLDHYPGFRWHLEERYTCLVRSDEECAIFALRPSDEQSSWKGTLSELFDEYRISFGRDPAVLNWHTGLDLEGKFPEHVVFSPSVNDRSLPYADASIDVVAVGEADAASIEEADRVAAAAIAVLSSNGEKRRGFDIRWKLEHPAELPTVSIVIPCHDGIEHTQVCIESLRETLPRKFRGELLVIDDASSDGTADYLAQVVAVDDRFKVLTNDANLGFLHSVNRGAEVAIGEILVFLNNDTILLPGWLQPLLEVFDARAHAGAVGGRLVYPDGVLQEAGGLVFADGSAAKFGYGDPDPEASLYSYLREVDYCSGCLLATRRAVFEEVGGFDIRYAPGFYEDTDYCFALRERGLHVYYQPESTIVHVEGATAGTDLKRGPKRYQVVNGKKFAEKWKATLEHQPQRPKVLSPEALYELAAPRRESRR